MKGITRFSNSLMEKYLPDPFLFVIILTLVIFVMGLGLTDSSPIQMVAFWGEGFWALLAFSMQMVLVLVTGYVLASSPIFKKGLGKLASFAKSPSSAIILVTLVSLAASWINWGFGLVIGALFAKSWPNVSKMWITVCLLPVRILALSFGMQDSLALSHYPLRQKVIPLLIKLG